MTEEWKEILPAFFQRTSVPVLKKFVHGCADDICGRKPPHHELLSLTGWTEEEFHISVFNTKVFLVDAVTGNYDFQLIESAFSKLDKQLTAAISNCVNVRSNELKESLLVLAATTPGTSLTDFDWKLKWVIGSSSLSTLQEPLLSVNLHLRTKTADCQLPNWHSNTAKQSTVNFELDGAELDSLISSLENIEDSPQR